MAGRNPAAAEAALLSICRIWESFICAKYMKKAGQYDTKRCPTCNSPRTCKNYFCLECEIGGLCPAVFRGDNEHLDHPWLQVRQYSRKDSVLSKSLAHFMSNEGLKHIHTNKLNEDERHCYLKSKQVVGSSSSSRITRTRARVEKICEGCMGSIHGSKHSTETFLVCSLQCLLKVAHKQPALILLAMNAGAMDPMQPPLFYIEKLKQSPRMPKTSTKTPIDEAPPLPQATGDSPLLEIHETLREEPVPLPPAIGDFSMFDTHEDLEVEAILAALSYPLEIDDYPMFGTLAEASFDGDFPMFETHEDLDVEAILAAFPYPLEIDDYPIFGTLAEASFGEALSLPPATKDFPMFGSLAEASFNETLPLPPATEDFPMFGFLAEASFGEALPLPPAPEDFPMFGFLAEASFGEALPLPPATEDFPMFDFLAEACFGEALPLPPATEDFPITFGTTSFGEALPVAPATEDSPMFERPCRHN